MLWLCCILYAYLRMFSLKGNIQQGISMCTIVPHTYFFLTLCVSGYMEKRKTFSLLAIFHADCVKVS